MTNYSNMNQTNEPCKGKLPRWASQLPLLKMFSILDRVQRGLAHLISGLSPLPRAACERVNIN